MRVTEGMRYSQVLSNLASIDRTRGAVNVTHHDIARTYDVQANVEGRDLGAVSSEIERIIQRMQKDFPRGTKVSMRGQVESMNTSFRGLAYGLVFAVLLVGDGMFYFLDAFDPALPYRARESRCRARNPTAARHACADHQ